MTTANIICAILILIGGGGLSTSLPVPENATKFEKVLPFISGALIFIGIIIAAVNIKF